mgnify:FL=1
MKTLKKVWGAKELRNRILFTLIMLIFLRMVSQITVPGVNSEFLKSYFGDNEAFNLMNAFTGGGLERLSVFALGVTPYITSSIIIQLFTISFPRLEQLAKEGESGRKKLTKYTQYVTLVLSLVSSISMVIGFRNQMLITKNYLTYAVVVATLTGGSMILVWLGNRITEKGIGNGISMILLFNILSRMPQDMKTLYECFMQGKTWTKMTMAGLVIAMTIVVVICLTLILNSAERRIPVVYTQKMQGRRFAGDGASNIPMKVNTAGVMPVIFATSLMTFPALILGLLGKTPNGIWATVTKALNSNNWFNPGDWLPTVGYILYVLLLIFFAYYYTTITFNSAEIANNLKKAGATIPGQRPGKDTELYLQKILKHVIMIGVIGLLIVCTIPLVISGVTGANVSFGGTSLIIIVSVILETVKQGKSMLSMKNANTFLR